MGVCFPVFTQPFCLPKSLRREEWSRDGYQRWGLSHATPGRDGMGLSVPPHPESC